MANNRRRVKLFILNESHQWDDHGTGHVSAMFTDQDNESNGIMLLVRSEEDGKVLLESLIQANTAYQKQQDTLVVWSEADSDIALSFQMKEGCDEIWEKICQVVGKDPSVDVTQPVDTEEEEPYEELSDYPSVPIELPKCELNRLDEICELCHSVLPSQIERDKLANTVDSENYIPQLLELFHMCEDLENIDGLNRLYEIFKTLFLLEKNVLFEVLFATDRIMDVIGVLEYDPAKKEPIKHREFLEHQVKFKEVLPMENKQLLAKIHQTYRIQFIKDLLVPVPSLFDENLSTLSSFLFFSKIEIVTMIQEDEWFLTELFQRLTDDEISDEKRKEVVFFMKELCNLSQSCQQPNREAFFKVLTDHGLLSSLETLMNFDDMDMKAAIVDILCCIVEFAPTMVRDYLSKEAITVDEDSILINMLIDQLICNADTGMGLLLVHLIRTLLDPENMGLGSNKMEKGQFLSFFYRHSMHVLTAPLFAVTATEQLSGKDDFKSATIQDYIIEILSFCVDHHTYHIKNYILSKDLLRRVLVLMKSRHKFLALAALRFTRKIVGIKDEFYNRYIIKGKLLAPVVQAFQQNGKKYNLVNSAILEMFEFIRLDDIKTLCAYIVEEHMKELSDVDYVETFRGLQVRYEQEKDRVKKNTSDRNGNNGIIHVNSAGRKRRDERSLDEDEETWFDSEEDDLSDTSNPEPSPSASPSPPAILLPTTASDSPLTKPLTAKFKDVDLLDSLPLRVDSPPLASSTVAGNNLLTGSPPKTAGETTAPAVPVKLPASSASSAMQANNSVKSAMNPIKLTAANTATSMLNSSSPPLSTTNRSNTSTNTNTNTNHHLNAPLNNSNSSTSEVKVDEDAPVSNAADMLSATDDKKCAAVVAGDLELNKATTNDSRLASTLNGDTDGMSPLDEKAASVHDNTSSPVNCTTLSNVSVNGLANSSDKRTTLVPLKKLGQPASSTLTGKMGAVKTTSGALIKAASPILLGGLVPYDDDDDDDDDDEESEDDEADNNVICQASPAKKQKLS